MSLSRDLKRLKKSYPLKLCKNCRQVEIEPRMSLCWTCSLRKAKMAMLTGKMYEIKML